MNENTIPHDGKEYKRQLLNLLWRTDKTLSDAGIIYFGVFGTCLGAAREHEIIPWDDDIDIAVRRTDFTDAIIALNSSDRQIFVDGHGFRSARIFNRIATGDSLERRRAYIDLYVIDYAPESKIHFFWNVLCYVGVSRIIAKRTCETSEAHPILYFIADFLTFPLRTLPTSLLNRIAEWFYVYERKSPLIKLSYDANRKRYFDRFFATVRRERFSSGTIPIPYEYDEYLTMTYGDWRTPPNENDRASHAFDQTGTIWNVKLPSDEERSFLPSKS